MASPIIWGPSTANNLTPNLEFANGAGPSILTGTVNPSSVATAANEGSLYLNSSSGVTYQKQDAGLTTNWIALSTSATSVTSVSVATANGLAGTSSGGTTPALTLSTTATGILQGNGTAISAASTTGSGSVVLATSPTLVTPNLGVASATSLTIPTFTSGSVVFASTSGILAQDNTNFFWDDVNLRLSLGGHLHTAALGVSSTGGTQVGFDLTSTSANTALQVSNDGAQFVAQFINATNSATQGAAFGGAFSRGTTNARTASLAGDQLMTFSGQGYNGSAFGPGYSGAIAVIATENTTATHNGGEIVLASTPNGSLGPVAGLILGQNQRIQLPAYTTAGVLVNDASGNVTTSTTTGTVTSVSVVSANGLAGTVATATTTPAITLSTTLNTPVIAGNGTSLIAATTTGTGSTAVLSTAPTLSNPIVGTQAQGDSSTKAASTSYVDVAVANAVSGVNPAVAVQAATTAASDTSSYTYNNGASGIGATLTGVNNTALTVDGFTFTALGQRLLVKNDTQSPSGAFNGVYSVTQLQASVLPLILTRALDYDQPSDINNTGAIPVINGTANGTTSWVQTAQIVTVGTTPLVFAQFTKNPANYLLKANNLSDVASASTSYNNISPMTTTGDIEYEASANTAARLPIGSTGNVLTVVGGVPAWATNAGTVFAPTVQKFLSSSGTYTTPTSPRTPVYIKIKMVGGGGGGGANGTGGGNGTAGTATSFGTSLLNANGGGLGTSNGNGALSASGGTASLGSGPIGVAITGAASTGPGSTQANIAGGAGAATPFAGGGNGGVPGGPTMGGTASTNSGAGGGGAGGSAAVGAGSGGGAGGYVEAIITSPLSTYAYSVGASGTGGLAGTSGAAGGAGAAGIIIVEEFYQ